VIGRIPARIDELMKEPAGIAGLVEEVELALIGARKLVHPARLLSDQHILSSIVSRGSDISQQAPGEVGAILRAAQVPGLLT
jgi:hypothetical protein